MPLPTTYRQYDPFLTPDWRWQRALELTRHRPRPARCTKHDDEVIRQTRAYLLAWNKLCHDDPGSHGHSEQLVARYPGLYFAHRIYSSPDDLIRCLLEARLLAAQDPQEIAEEMKILPATVEWYEQVFFNVSGRLGHHDWIISQVLGPAAGRGLVHRPYDASLKLFAFFGGVALLRFMLHGFLRGGKPVTDTEVRAYVSSQIRTGLDRRTLLETTSGFEVNQFNIMDLLSVQAKFVELENELGAGQARNQIEANLHVMLSELNWTTGQPPAHQPSLPYEGGAVELYDEELLDAAAGVVPEDMSARLQPFAEAQARLGLVVSDDQAGQEVKDDTPNEQHQSGGRGPLPSDAQESPAAGDSGPSPPQ